MLTTTDTARYAASLRLDLDSDELQGTTDYLNDMEAFLAVLDKVDTDGVEPMYSPLESEDQRLRKEAEGLMPG